jgi:hypothetical protein
MRFAMFGATRSVTLGGEWSESSDDPLKHGTTIRFVFPVR